MESEGNQSVSEWLGRLKAGESEAAQLLWNRYSKSLIAMASRRMADMPKLAVDEEDIAQNVFSSVCRAAKNGHFSGVMSRDDLWWILLDFTKKKVVDHVRHESARKREFGHAKLNGDLGKTQHWVDFDELVGREPTPEFAVMLDDQYRYLLGILRNDTLRNVAVLRIEGHSTAEIASRLAIGVRAIERKLQLIREQWLVVVSEG